MRRYFFSLTALLLFNLPYQVEAQVDKELIVKLSSEDATSFLNTHNRNSNNNRNKIIGYETLFEEESIYLFKLDTDDILKSKILFESKIEVVYASPNATLKPRKKPNDNFVDQQWALDIIQAFDAWEVSTGGLDFGEREIVIAVLDDGFQQSHPELRNKIWTNPGESEGDNVDNDNNGYIDDFHGLNVDNNTDEHPVKLHGTAVSGIIGAEGNNAEGITGINWDIKILPVSGVNSVSDIIKAYGYIYGLRKKYNDTAGAEGAYIVATNYSGGIDSTFASTHPAWCDMYDNLGAEGVLSIGATTNTGYDVDEIGDLPSTCQSPYLIAVTNTDQSDEKVPDAGFGKINIDLGAPGADILTLDNDDGYKDFDGTSAAAPQVAGAVALLYTTPCPTFYDLTFTDPADAAMKVKQALMDNVDKRSSLENNTVSGGRLNINKALMGMQELCGGTSGNLSIRVATPLSYSENIEIIYETPDSKKHTIMLSGLMGRTLQVHEVIPPFFGDKRFTLKMTGYPNGIYIISVFNDTTIESVKAIKF